MIASSLASVVGRDERSSVIDDDHLKRMTLGDSRLEHEVLEIFARQIAILLTRIADAEPKLAAAVAHTLMGSACGIGAWRVANAAERVEHAAAGPLGRAALGTAVEELKAAAIEVSGVIDARLGRPLDSPPVARPD